MTGPSDASEPSYLRPYLRAAERHGGGFGALLWASRATQAARFAAVRRLFDLGGKAVLDAGCGRADFLDDLLAHGVAPRRYTGVEAVAALAAAAEAKRRPAATIVRGDFVKDPAVLDAGADVIVFSGSLNTLGGAAFYTTLRVAAARATSAVAFNFLASPTLAAADHLTWHRTADVLRFAEALAPHVRLLDDYLAGDCTIALYKRPT